MLPNGSRKWTFDEQLFFSPRGIWVSLRTFCKKRQVLLFSISLRDVVFLINGTFVEEEGLQKCLFIDESAHVYTETLGPIGRNFMVERELQ